MSRDEDYEPTALFWWVVTFLLLATGAVLPILWGFALLTFFIALDVQEIDNDWRKRMKARGLYDGR